MADRPKTTGRDYGHRTYLKSDDYMTAMRRPSDKQYDNRHKRPHSDDKKPYYPDEYPEMEHYWTPYDPPNTVPPGVPDDDRIPPNIPGLGGPDPDQDTTGDFDGCVFTVPTGPTVLQEGDTTFHGIGLYNPFKPNSLERYLPDPLVKLEVAFGPVAILSKVAQINACAISLTPNCTVSAAALEGFDHNDYGKNASGDYFPAQIVATTKSGGQCFWDLQVSVCPPDTALAWDSDNNPTSVNAGDSALIYVTGGTAPFTWAVSGEGFSMAQAKTGGRSNTLTLSAAACGTATITVTDACDTQVSGKVRSNNGEWENTGLEQCVCVGGAGACCTSYAICVVDGIRYAFGDRSYCHLEGNGGVWYRARCSWLGGCTNNAGGSCANMCSDTVQNPCCSYSPGEMCSICLDDFHDTIYRNALLSASWECET